MITKENKELAQWAMDFAVKNGCQASRVSISNGSNSSYEIRDMKIDKLQQATENSMSIHLFVDNKYGAFSTNRLNKGELEKFIRNGIDSTRYLTEDPARSLPDPSRYYKGNRPDLQLYDSRFDSVNPDDKVSLAMRTCNEIMNKDPRIISVGASYDDQKWFSYMVTSNGFEGEKSGSYFSVSGSVSVKGEGESRPSDFWYDSSLYYDKLIKYGIGTKALERVLRKIGQQKIASGKYPMILDNTVSARLLSPVISALYGSSIQQNNSFLLNKLNEKVLGGNITIMDDPHQLQASGARYFDNEGVATQRMPIFENGVLKTYFIDTYNSNKLNMPPTIATPSILTIGMGNKDCDGLVASLDKGILVTGFNGGNSNSSTGDFSFGVEGFLVENGKVTQPVSEMNITGNLLTLWNNLTEAGNDPRPSSNWKIPSLLFDGVDFSGL